MTVKEITEPPEIVLPTCNCAGMPGTTFWKVTLKVAPVPVPPVTSAELGMGEAYHPGKVTGLRAVMAPLAVGKDRLHLNLSRHGRAAQAGEVK